MGARARMVRRCRGLSLEVVAGPAGITAGYLSMLERGLRGFNRRGLVEDLAEALGCSVTDLTGQPYVQSTVDVVVSLDAIRLALNDYSLDERPVASPRPLEALVGERTLPQRTVTRPVTTAQAGISRWRCSNSSPT